LARRLAFPALFPDARAVEAEVPLGRSRLDFRVELPHATAYVEVKACTLVEHGVALFPDAPTLRGARHVRELAAIDDPTKEAHVLFVVGHGDPRVLVPNIHADPAFSRVLREAAKSVRLHAATLHVTSEGDARLLRPSVPIDVGPVELVDSDCGAYLLVAEISRAQQVPVGALGDVFFPAGHYVYVGSAMTNLSHRVKRHLSSRKRLRWHIDYLLRIATRVRAFPVYSAEDLECEIAQQVARISDRSVPRFGASDCRCPSHLFHFAADPIATDRFQRVLQRFRHTRMGTRFATAHGAGPEGGPGAPAEWRRRLG
jgi:sugar fermentation stimulation protein A